jgi:hypothetical protein
VSYVVARHLQRNLAGAAEIPEGRSNVDVKLAEGIIFTGKVVDVEGRAIEGAGIDLSFWSGGTGVTVNEKTATDAEGRYEISAAPRDCEFTTRASKEGYGDKFSERLFSSPTTGNRMEVEPLVLRLADRSVSGVVVDEQDRPVSKASVSCYGPDQPWRHVMADDQGRFTVEGICVGPIEVHANIRDLSGSIRTQAGEQDVKVVLNPSGRDGSASKSVSLLGRQLPDMKAFGTPIADVNAVGKPLVICFFDMNQRPSRNAVVQLAKRAEELKHKGVAVIAIQAGEADAASLEQWRKDQGLAIPVGSIKADVKKTTSVWGIQSLPWLVLTDAQHVVRAEGFALNETDDKIATVK